MLCPDEFADSIDSIDIENLRERGIRAMLLDLDNTLVAWQKYDISPKVAGWLREARDLGIKACLVSNSHSSRRVTRLASELGLPFAKKAMKPGGRGFREALGILGVESGEAVVIGDQVFTDVLGGNRLGMYTILVSPIHPREFIGTKITRIFERIFLKWLKRRNGSDIEGTNSRKE